MSASTRDQVVQLNQTAEDLLHETWELFTRLRETNEALLRQTHELTSKINLLSRSTLDGDLQ